ATVWAPEPVPSGSPPTGQNVAVPAPATPDQCSDWGRLAPHGSPPPDRPIWRAPPSWRLAPVTQAGAHPDGSATFWLARNSDRLVDGTLDNVYGELPAGFVGDPTAVPKCTAEQFAVRPLQCPPETQVGVLHLYIVGAGAGGGVNYQASTEEILPVYNLEPRKGNVAELGVAYVSGEDATTARIVAKARTNGDFGVTTFVSQLPAALPVIGQSVTLWGVPWLSSHDVWRPPTAWRPASSSPNRFGEIPPQGLDPDDRVAYRPAWGEIKPFLSNPTECSGATLETRLAIDSYEAPGSFTPEGDPDPLDVNWKRYASPAPRVTGCDKVPFAADLAVQPTSTVADSASGLIAGLDLPQNDDLPFAAPAAGAGEAEVDAYVDAAAGHWASDAGLATSQLDRAVVSLPAGVSVNPAGAAGLEGCSDAGIGVTDSGTNPMRFNNGDPFDKDGGADGAECPAGSKIGTVEVDTPLLDEPLTGEVVLGVPKSTDPTSGEMFRMFVVVRSVERGLIAKIYGSAVADPQTGRLTATFDKNPRVPFETMRMRLKGGDRGLLALPPRCQASGWTSEFSPWTAAHDAGGLPVSDGGAFVTDQRCGFGFAPGLRAGMNGRQGGGSGAFSFVLTREEGQQWLAGVSVSMPGGLLAAVRDVALCSNAQAAANACPAASRIGMADAGAGSGAPFFLERKGDVFLTEGYKGAPYGLAVSVPVEAGPFRGPLALSPIVVRQALHVDPSTAAVTAVSDPLPQIHHGIPLRVRQIIVTVDRPGFMRNPTDCSPKRIAADVTSVEGAVARPASPYQATGCAALPFRPKLALRLTGRKQMRTGRHPGVRARVTQRSGEAGIEKARVRLPKTLALDPENARALCEYEDGVRPDLERHCPKGSIVGRARAVSPLLKGPLSGNVYFVKNVRRSSSGNLIRTLPMIVVALRGEVAINLRGESSVDRRNRLVNTFASVPDAPISRFDLRIAGGRSGILAVTRTRRSRIDLCSRRQVAAVDMDGHNGRRRDGRTRVSTPCKASKKKRRADRRKRSVKRRR
ncbi:MAG TPA: hypothetical protein VHF88_05515, partial [Thermoleophilaceae bacterium]|nr:hypothetical protein [Thermoleophilaceae bacterium]